jgi:hypothetical protein
MAASVAAPTNTRLLSSGRNVLVRHELLRRGGVLPDSGSKTSLVAPRGKMHEGRSLHAEILVGLSDILHSKKIFAR